MLGKVLSGGLICLFACVGVYGGQKEITPEKIKESKLAKPVKKQADKPSVKKVDKKVKRQIVISSLPENIKLIIGQGKTRNYYIRVRAIHQLSKDLPQEQVEALYKFLYDRLEDQELKDLEFNGLKNELVLELMAQHITPEALAGHLVKMYQDKTFDPTWRDYCVQFFGKWYEKAPHNEGRKQMLENLFKSTEEVEGTIGGTVVTMLRHLVHLREVDRNRVSKLAYKVLTAPKCSLHGKIAALQVCAELRNEKALPIARKIAQSNQNKILRMSAIAAVG